MSSSNSTDAINSTYIERAIADVVKVYDYCNDVYHSSGAHTTWFSPKSPLRSHSLVCIKNYLFIVG